MSSFLFKLFKSTIVPLFIDLLIVVMKEAARRSDNTIDDNAVLAIETNRVGIIDLIKAKL